VSCFRFGYNQGDATKVSDVLIEQLLGVWMCAWVHLISCLHFEPILKNSACEIEGTLFNIHDWVWISARQESLCSHKRCCNACLCGCCIVNSWGGRHPRSHEGDIRNWILCQILFLVDLRLIIFVKTGVEALPGIGSVNSHHGWPDLFSLRSRAKDGEFQTKLRHHIC
jgi:hypothetical protein